MDGKTHTKWLNGNEMIALDGWMDGRLARVTHLFFVNINRKKKKQKKNNRSKPLKTFVYAQLQLQFRIIIMMKCFKYRDTKI